MYHMPIYKTFALQFKMKLGLKYPGKMTQKRNGAPSTAFLTSILI
jgi:hypothetical protein